MFEKCTCGEVVGVEEPRCPRCGRVNERHFVEVGRESRVPIAVGLGLLMFACIKYGLPWYAATVIAAGAFLLTGLIQGAMNRPKRD